MALTDEQLEAIDPTHLPTAGDGEVLIAFLDYYRAVIERKAAGLTREQLDIALAPSDMTLGGMLKHLAYVEDWWFRQVFLGLDPSPPWDTAPWEDDHDWDWHSAAGDEPEALHARYRDACGRSRAVLDEHRDLHALAARDNRHGVRFSLRWILVHMIEEYARHAGHADLIRQAIDGATGD